MARRWVVRNSDNVIIEYTEWAGRVATSDETIYTDPANDERWVQGGTYDGTTYADPAGRRVPDDITLDAGRKRAATRAAREQLLRWDANLEGSGSGQPSAIRALGHDLILGQMKALYLRAANSQLTVAGLESYAGQISQGAADITNVPTFFRLATSLNKGSWVDADPLEWATLTSTTAATRRNLQAAITNAPTDFRVAVRDFSMVDLSTDAWIDVVITL